MIRCSFWNRVASFKRPDTRRGIDAVTPLQLDLAVVDHAEHSMTLCHGGGSISSCALLRDAFYGVHAFLLPGAAIPVVYAWGRKHGRLPFFSLLCHQNALMPFIARDSTRLVEAFFLRQAGSGSLLIFAAAVAADPHPPTPQCQYFTNEMGLSVKFDTAVRLPKDAGCWCPLLLSAKQKWCMCRSTLRVP